MTTKETTKKEIKDFVDSLDIKFKTIVNLKENTTTITTK